jgi:hypothetical protein
MQDMPRPFKLLKELDIEQLGEEIAAAKTAADRPPE